MGKKIIIPVLLVFLLSGCAQLPFMEPRSLTGKRLFEQKCSHCHQLPNLTYFRNAEHVKQEVRAMRGEDPAWINNDEARYIADYIVFERKL